MQPDVSPETETRKLLSIEDIERFYDECPSIDVNAHCSFPTLEAVWRESHRLHKKSVNLARLVARDLKAGSSSVLADHHEMGSFRPFLMALRNEPDGARQVVDLVLRTTPEGALAEHDALEAMALDAEMAERGEAELPRAGGSMLQAMGAANKFVELFDEIRDCAIGAIVWHNLGRPDPWDGTQPEVLALWTQFADTAHQKGPYAACRTFSVLPPHDAWLDFTVEAEEPNGGWDYVVEPPDAPDSMGATQDNTPLNPSPPASPVEG